MTAKEAITIPVGRSKHATVGHNGSGGLSSHFDLALFSWPQTFELN